MLQESLTDEFRLLGDADPAPCRLEPGERPILVVCDHAGNRVPSSLGNLGVADHHLNDHIAWDIGAAEVARRIASALEASLMLATYSRLVIDLNRSERDRSAVPEISDGILIPANVGLSGPARRQRFDAIHSPYHMAVDRALTDLAKLGRRPVMLAIHSFTPRMSGIWRPWHAGVLWDKDPRLAIPLLEELRRPATVVIGDNEPYSGRHTADYTIDRHAEGNGIAYAAIEIRQDLIRTAEGQREWADRLSAALMTVIDDFLSWPTHVAAHGRSN